MHDADRDYFSRFTLGADPELDWEDSYRDDFGYTEDEDTFTFDDEHIPDMDDYDPDDEIRFED